MTIKKEIFFCLACHASAFSREKIIHEACGLPIHIVEAQVNFKMPRTRWVKFCDWFFSIDIGYGLAFMGAVIINVILLQHFNLSFKQGLLEAFCLGFVLIRLFKD